MTAERVWKGDPDLEQFLVPVESLTPHPRNPRTHNLTVIAQSLERFGQLRPVIVQKSSGLLVAGHGTTKAASDLLGWTHIARVTPDLDDDEAMRFLLMDNRTSDLGGYETELLSRALADLAEKGGLEGTGYGSDDLDDILADLARAQPPAEPADADSEGAAERARAAAGADMREVVLMFSGGQYVQFGNYLKMLMREHGTAGVAETVFACVEQAAKAL